MKQQINPVVAAVLVIIVLGVAGFFIWRGTAGTGGPAAGEKGNSSPFAPGGAAVGSAGAKPTAAGAPKAIPGPPGGLHIPQGGSQ